jgi:hypothetical protein
MSQVYEGRSKRTFYIKWGYRQQRSKNVVKQMKKELFLTCGRELRCRTTFLAQTHKLTTTTSNTSSGLPTPLTASYHLPP